MVILLIMQIVLGFEGCVMDNREMIVEYLKRSEAITCLINEKISYGTNFYEYRLGPVSNTYAIVHIRAADRVFTADIDIIIPALYTAFQALDLKLQIVLIECDRATAEYVSVDTDLVIRKLWICADIFNDIDTFKKMCDNYLPHVKKKAIDSDIIKNVECKSILLKSINDDTESEDISL